MRLNSYIMNEGRKLKIPQGAQKYVPSARGAIKRHLKEFIRKMDQFNWVVDLRKLCMILTSTYYNFERVKFEPDTQNRNTSFDFVTGGDFWKSGDVVIYLSDKTPDYFDRLSDMDNFKKKLRDFENNQFMRELLHVLSVEAMHVKSISRAHGVLQFLIHMPIKQYLSSPDGIEAHALEAAKEYDEDQWSDTRALYYELFGTGSKTYKKFKERFDQLKEMNPNDRLRNVNKQNISRNVWTRL